MAKQKPSLNQSDIDLLKDIFLTKDDAANFATRKDLDNLVTKDDAKNFATKEDVSSLEKGQKVLEKGQRDLEKGQRDLEKGQKVLEKRLKKLEEGQKRLEKKIGTVSDKLDKDNLATVKRVKKIEKHLGLQSPEF